MPIAVLADARLVLRVTGQQLEAGESPAKMKSAFSPITRQEGAVAEHVCGSAPLARRPCAARGAGSGTNDEQDGEVDEEGRGVEQEEQPRTFPGRSVRRDEAAGERAEADTRGSSRRAASRRRMCRRSGGVSPAISVDWAGQKPPLPIPAIARGEKALPWLVDECVGAVADGQEDERDRRASRRPPSRSTSEPKTGPATMLTAPFVATIRPAVPSDDAADVVEVDERERQHDAVPEGVHQPAQLQRHRPSAAAGDSGRAASGAPADSTGLSDLNLSRPSLRRARHHQPERRRMRSHTFRRVALLVGVLALLVPLAASAGGGRKHSNKPLSVIDAVKRDVFATDDQGNLLSFRAAVPQLVRSKQITGLPAGVTLKGIDFRPATGDLYALGSDKVVYRVNPRTAIALAEGPAFETMANALNGDRIGFDFNPTVDRIRVTSDADDNLRLNPDTGALAAKDTALTPAEVTVVGSAYTNSSFAAFANRPAATMLFAYDVSGNRDRIWLQQPANDGTLMNPKSVALQLGSDVGFDIAGADNVGYVAGTAAGRLGRRALPGRRATRARRAGSAESARAG